MRDPELKSYLNEMPPDVKINIEAELALCAVRAQELLPDLYVQQVMLSRQIRGLEAVVRVAQLTKRTV